MSKESSWYKGYKEVKNVIHNDIGITKGEILDIIKKMVKEEISDIITEKGDYIYASIQEIIRNEIRSEMINAITDHKYPKVTGSTWFYGGRDGRGENSFKDYISGVMKEEISNLLRSQFEVKLDINMKDNNVNE